MAARKNLERRKRAANSLAMTERSFVDGLRYLQQHYLASFKMLVEETEALSQDDTSVVFRDLETLIIPLDAWCRDVRQCVVCVCCVGCVVSSRSCACWPCAHVLFVLYRGCVVPWLCCVCMLRVVLVLWVHSHLCIVCVCVCVCVCVYIYICVCVCVCVMCCSGTSWRNVRMSGMRTLVSVLPSQSASIAYVPRFVV